MCRAKMDGYGSDSEDWDDDLQILSPVGSLGSLGSAGSSAPRDTDTHQSLDSAADQEASDRSVRFLEAIAFDKLNGFRGEDRRDTPGLDIDCAIKSKTREHCGASSSSWARVKGSPEGDGTKETIQGIGREMGGNNSARNGRKEGETDSSPLGSLMLMGIAKDIARRWVMVLVLPFLSFSGSYSGLICRRQVRFPYLGPLGAELLVASAAERHLLHCTPERSIRAEPHLALHLQMCVSSIRIAKVFVMLLRLKSNFHALNSTFSCSACLKTILFLIRLQEVSPVLRRRSNFHAFNSTDSSSACST